MVTDVLTSINDDVIPPNDSVMIPTNDHENAVNDNVILTNDDDDNVVIPANENENAVIANDVVVSTINDAEIIPYDDDAVTPTDDAEVTQTNGDIHPTAMGINIKVFNNKEFIYTAIPSKLPLKFNLSSSIITNKNMSNFDCDCWVPVKSFSHRKAAEKKIDRQAYSYAFKCGSITKYIGPILKGNKKVGFRRILYTGKHVHQNSEEPNNPIISLSIPSGKETYVGARSTKDQQSTVDFTRLTRSMARSNSTTDPPISVATSSDLDKVEVAPNREIATFAENSASDDEFTTAEEVTSSGDLVPVGIDLDSAASSSELDLPEPEIDSSPSYGKVPSISTRPVFTVGNPNSSEDEASSIGNYGDSPAIIGPEDDSSASIYLDTPTCINMGPTESASFDLDLSLDPSLTFGLLTSVT